MRDEILRGGQAQAATVVPPSRPAQLPRDVADFTGRVAEIARLVALS